MNRYIMGLHEVQMSDVNQVGGKNASLGEMIKNLTKSGKVKVPGGFATTADAYREFLAHEGLADRINEALDRLDVSDVKELVKVGSKIRNWVMNTPFPPEFEKSIDEAFENLEAEYGKDVSWAVRSSATAEDLPDASFAGQQETVLNVKGIKDIKKYILEVFASLFNDRAIAYRVHQGFDHSQVALSAGIQKMVRSDIGASGVMFTLDTESGFKDVVFITGNYGLGEMVVQGGVNPDEFYVHKQSYEAGFHAIINRTLGSKKQKMIYASKGESPVEVVDVPENEQQKFCLNDAQIHELAKQALEIEKHYKRPMDIEWALDGLDGNIYIVQARPETVQSRKGKTIDRYTLKKRGEVITVGRSIGALIGSGKAKLIANLDEMDKIQEGDVLVTDMTDPDWEPIMKKASAIVTNRGGRTCHAAIIAREMGVPAVVGCGDATDKIADGAPVTVSCAEGDIGYIYKEELEYKCDSIEINSMPEIPVKIMMNVGNPERAFDFAQLPNEGIGLARLEFIINNMIGIHPKALINYETLEDQKLKAKIDKKISAYESPKEYFIERMVEGIATLAAAFHPKPVILRMSDFKTNEYAHLLGGENYEPKEDNPMIGFRGATRYISEEFRDCFDLECEAIHRVREKMGLTNLQIMIPFVRSLQGANRVIELLSENGLKRGENDLKIIMMCEVPSNAVLAEEFLEMFDGFSIGSNDMTQLTLGLDRDSELIAHVFDEMNPAVLKMVSMAIQAAKKQGKYIGICGQGPSDQPEFADWLFKEGIGSISLNPDSVLETWIRFSKESKH
ncbi:phosphoenolpyruvate synthase [Gammaproteobacteria bacterium]|nr:phosphoenolpyruvate synthase [Gammaproteobacteria bacterium]